MRPAQEGVRAAGNADALGHDALEALVDLLEGDARAEAQVLAVFVAELHPDEVVPVLGELAEDAVHGLGLWAMESDARGRDVDAVDASECPAVWLLDDGAVLDGFLCLLEIVQKRAHAEIIRVSMGARPV